MDTNTEKIPCKDERQKWKDPSISQGIPKVARVIQAKSDKEGRKMSPRVAASPASTVFAKPQLCETVSRLL